MSKPIMSLFRRIFFFIFLFISILSSLPANIRLSFVKVFSALVVFFLTVHSADAILSSELSGDTLLLFAKSAAYALLKKTYA